MYNDICHFICVSSSVIDRLNPFVISNITFLVIRTERTCSSEQIVHKLDHLFITNFHVHLCSESVFKGRKAITIRSLERFIQKHDFFPWGKPTGSRCQSPHTTASLREQYFSKPFKQWPWGLFLFSLTEYHSSTSKGLKGFYKRLVHPFPLTVLAQSPRAFFTRAAMCSEVSQEAPHVTHKQPEGSSNPFTSWPCLHYYRQPWIQGGFIYRHILYTL